ncbi:PucR family transcriptional regulator [Streptomyces olivochromogenes]|uniref:PucR family transcriptional regulator n=1 Tax=Streptomyces olivochromogenes TaxID=1963 RepID=UPI00369AEF45
MTAAARVRLTPRLVAGLTAPPETAAVPASEPDVIASVVEAVGENPVRWAVALAAQGLTRVLAEVTEEHKAALVPRLAPAIEQTGLDLLLALYGESRPFALNPDEVAINTYLARTGVPFQGIVQGLRLIRQQWTVALLDLADGHQPAAERGQLVREVTEVVNEFFDASVDAVIADYFTQRQRLLAQRIADQRIMITSVIDGEPVDVDAARRTLGIDLTGRHLGLILWLDSAGSSPDPHGDLGHALREVAVALGSPALLTLDADRSTLWAWATSPASGPRLPDCLPQALPGIANDVGIAVGRTAPGRDGFRRTHLAALDAYRVARLTGRPEQVTVYDDIALAALLTEDPERGRWFIDEELGPLAAPDRTTTDLRQTLLSYLDHGGSIARAAEALYVHRNTVVYRLRRAEELLGRPTTDRTLETHTALRLAMLFATRAASGAGPALRSASRAG